jgi:hypothetical protein
VRIASDRYRTAENSLLTKHVVAAGLFAKDAGSTPAASTTFYWAFDPGVHWGCILVVAAADFPDRPSIAYSCLALFLCVRLFDDFVFLPLTIGSKG